MRLIPRLFATATLALALFTPAAAAVVTVSSGPGSGFANQSCDGPGGPFNGASVVTINRTCTRGDVGEATGNAVASLGHLGASAIATSHNGDSLAAGIGAEAIFSDFITFTSTDPTATSADVSVNLLLDGALGIAGLPSVASVEGSVTLGGVFDFFRFNLTDHGFQVDQNAFSTVGTLGPLTNAVLTSHTAHVALNSPVNFVLLIQTSSGASGPGGFGSSDFSSSFKFPSSGVFNLTDGVTANAGDYLVNNRFIDLLAPAPGGDVPEPATWALMIAGLGLAGAGLRRRKTVTAGRPVRRRLSVFLAGAACAALAAPAGAAPFLNAHAGPGSSSATQSCTPPQGGVSGSTPLSFNTTCNGGSFPGSSFGGGFAGGGHVGAVADALSNNGDSLVSQNSGGGSYQDFIVFTSTDPTAVTTNVSANLLLDGVLEAGGNIAGARFEVLVVLGGGTWNLVYDLDQAGNLTGRNDGLIIDSGAVGAVTNLAMHTPFMTVFLNSPIMFRLDVNTSAAASGPASHGLSDFSANSLKLPSDGPAFGLSDGVTANVFGGGDYLVNNHFVDPFAPAPGDGVPEPGAWALMIAGLGLVGAALRRRRVCESLPS